jgi:hypothetical protein
MATLFVHALAFFVPSWPPPGLSTELSVLVMFSVCSMHVAQVGLVLIWAGLGTTPSLLRIVLAYVAISLSWLSLSHMQFAPDLFAWPAGPALLMASVIIPLTVARRSGFRLLLFADEPAPPGDPLQVSIRGLFAITVAVAALLALGSDLESAAPYRYRIGVNGVWVRSLLPHFTLARQSVLIAATGISLFVAAVFLTVWACLSLGYVWIRMAVAAVTCISLGALLAYYLQAGILGYATGCAFGAILFGVISSTLLVFRWFGYRFSRLDVIEPNVPTGSAGCDEVPK